MFKFNKTFYGLKQAPQASFENFCTVIGQLRFFQSPYDYVIFNRRSNRGIILLFLYEDDMIITGDDIARIDELKQFLSQQFEMKDLDLLSYFLGLEVFLLSLLATLFLKLSMHLIFN